MDTYLVIKFLTDRGLTSSVKITYANPDITTSLIKTGTDGMINSGAMLTGSGVPVSVVNSVLTKVTETEVAI